MSTIIIQEQTAGESLLETILSHLISEALKLGVPKVQPELQAVQKIEPNFFCARTFDTAMAVYMALEAFISNGEAATIKAAR